MDEGWYRLFTVFKFGVLKRIQTPESWFWDIGADESLQTVAQVAELNFESKFEPLPVIWQSLPKAVPEENRRFWLQNQCLSSLDLAPAQLGRVGRRSSCCWQQPARLRKTWCHSFYADSVQEYNKVLMICKFRAFICCWPKQCPFFAPSFNQSLVSEQNMTGTKQHVLNWILSKHCKAADLNQWHVLEMGVCSDSNWTAQQLQMAACKSLETVSGMILIK